MNIKQKIYEYFVSKAEPRQAAFPRYADIQSVIILYESDWLERNEIIKKMSSQLQSEGKTVALWGFVHKKDVQSLILPIGRIVGARDINLFDRPKEQTRNDMKAGEYDLLIDLTQNDILPLHYLALDCPAKFKAGRRREDGVLDFMVDMPVEETPEALFDQIIRYLKMINRGER